MQGILGSFKSQRLLVEEARVIEAPLLQEICESWAEKGLIEGYGFDSDYIVKCFTEGDLPPVATASKDLYRLMAIKEAHGLSAEGQHKLVGLFDVYHGYPFEDCIYISLMVVDVQYRSFGYGRECMMALMDQAVSMGYSRMMVGVHLKNWPALRFWTGLGFDKVVGVYGDETYGPHAYAIIGLEKGLYRAR